MSAMEQNDELREAYMSVLGGVSACSPAIYGAAMTEISQRVGRTDDESFRADVRVIAATAWCPLNE